MHTVFQEIRQIAREKLREALQQGTAAEGDWDADSWEEAVRRFTRELGHTCLQVWAEERAQQAHAQAVRCACGHRRWVKKRKVLRWMTTFGPVKVEEPYLVCPRDGTRRRPFQQRSGLKCRGRSRALQRVLTDFGAEKSFAQASRQLWEHYGVEVHPSCVRRVVEAQACRAERFCAQQFSAAVQAYEQGEGKRLGVPWLIVESDGSLIRTGRLDPLPRGEPASAEEKGRRQRQTLWREVRLTTVQRPGEVDRRYAAVLGPPEQVGEQMFALALLAGWGEDTWVHGVGDGAPWIAQQMATVFPRHRYLLDRYHLLEHLHAGAAALPTGASLAGSRWVEDQLARIDRREVPAVIKECRTAAGASAEHPLAQLAQYLEHQQDHLDYAAAQGQDLPLGSGAVEGGHRHIIHARLKLPGTWWKPETVNPMLALRVLRANGWWEHFWN